MFVHVLLYLEVCFIPAVLGQGISQLLVAPNRLEYMGGSFGLPRRLAAAHKHEGKRESRAQWNNSQIHLPLKTPRLKSPTPVATDFSLLASLAFSVILT